MSPTNAPEVRAIRKWFLLALAASLLLHAFLFVYFTRRKLEHFAADAPVPRLVPPPFTVKQVVINEELLKPASTPEPKKVDPPKVVLQNDKPMVETVPAEVRLSPNAPPSAAVDSMTKAIAADKPRVEPAKLNGPEPNAQVERDISSLHEQIGPKNAPKIAAGTGGKLPESNDDGPRNSIDVEKAFANPDLIGDGSAIKMEDKKGGGNGGALFEYDSAKLSPMAIGMLQKISTIINRYPRATFTVEGYTDSFGTMQYNEKLSRARAESVKAWIVANMKLDPAKIITKGCGSTRFVVPATGTREEQAQNRRVEIVIATPKN